MPLVGRHELSQQLRQQLQRQVLEGSTRAVKEFGKEDSGIADRNDGNDSRVAEVGRVEGRPDDGVQPLRTHPGRVDQSLQDDPEIRCLCRDKAALAS